MKRSAIRVRLSAFADIPVIGGAVAGSRWDAIAPASYPRISLRCIRATKPEDFHFVARMERSAIRVSLRVRRHSRHRRGCGWLPLGRACASKLPRISLRCIRATKPEDFHFVARMSEAQSGSVSAFADIPVIGGAVAGSRWDGLRQQATPDFASLHPGYETRGFSFCSPDGAKRNPGQSPRSPKFLSSASPFPPQSWAKIPARTYRCSDENGHSDGVEVNRCLTGL